jgi:LmbE family N-acetylglucosaminyl deacetylase
MNLKLMCVMAHPDDETMGIGGTIARYTHEGIEVYLVTATRGEHGWFDDPADYPGPEKLGQIREQELYQAAETLGIKEVNLLDYIDGELDQAEPRRVISQIASHLLRIRPQVVLTFGPDGIYGHPDHIAICQFTTAAVVAAAAGLNGSAHSVSKLYYLTITKERLEAYEAGMGDLVMHIDGQERRGPVWKKWMISAVIDTSAYWEQVLQAVSCHQTQITGYEPLKNLPEAYHQQVWGVQHYYRAFSLVNGGRKLEDDLFEGLRVRESLPAINS